MKRSLLFCMLVIAVLQINAQYSWQALPAFPGPGRHHAIGFSHGGKGYVLTGVGTSQYKDFYEYDTLTGAWTQLPDYPGPIRSYGIGAVVNDTAYIGLGYSGSGDLTDWWSYDFSTATWTQRNTNPMPPRRHPTAVALNGKIYVGMGDNSSGVQYRDWWQYDPTNDSWTQMTNYPGLKMHHPVCTTDGNLIYLSEGHLIELTTNTGSTDFYSYNTATDTWTTLADMPGPGVVAGASFALPTNKIYSGCGITEPVETWHNEFYEYDIATGIWDTIANYPGVGNFAPVYFVIGNAGYVCTGSTGAVPTTEFYKYAPMLTLDASVTDITFGPGCGTITPMVTVSNFGLTTISGCTLNYKIDNNSIQTQTVSGNIVTNGTQTFTLPTLTASSGSHTFTCFVSGPNSLTDGNASNDSLVKPFTVLSSVTVNVPIVEGFTSATFPPAGWLLDNPDGGLTWDRNTSVGGFGNSTTSAMIDFYNYPLSGAMDMLYSPAMNFTSMSGNSGMTFSVAHARYDMTYCDELDVDVTTDCGVTWTTVYTKNCTTLPTASPTTAAFTPTATQWRTDTVSLSAFNGSASVIVRFRSVNDYGNDLYIDDINIDAGVGVHELNKGFDFSIYPNPSNDRITIQGSSSSSTMNYAIYNAIGALVATGAFSGGQNYNTNISLAALSNGIYFIKLTDDHSSVTKKLIKE